MGNVQVFEFGSLDGIRSYGITGRKVDLERIVQECRNADANFQTTPKIERLEKDEWMVLLQIKIPITPFSEG